MQEQQSVVHDGKDPVGVMLEKSVIPYQEFQQLLNYIRRVYYGVLNIYNGQKPPQEIQSAIEEVNNGLGELEYLANGGELPVQRADIVYLINPVSFDKNLRTLSSHLPQTL